MTVEVAAVGSVATATGTSLSVTSPAGQVGDLLVFFLMHDDYSDGALSPLSPPITLDTVHDGTPQLGDDSRAFIYAGIETQTSGRSFSFGTLTASEECKGVCIRFRGHDPTTPIQAGKTVRKLGPAFPGGTDANRIGDMFVGFIAGDSTFTSPSAPVNWTQRVNSSATNYAIYVATRPADQYPFPHELDELGIGHTSTSTGDFHAYTFVISKDESESYTLSGVTKDKNGNVLGSCLVALFKNVGGSPEEYRFVQSTISDPSTGAYSFTVYDNPSSFMVYAIKDDAPHVFDCTDDVLQPT